VLVSVHTLKAVSRYNYKRGLYISSMSHLFAKPCAFSWRFGLGHYALVHSDANDL